MKSLIWVILLWLVSACTVGWLGDTWLQQRWRQDAITNFQRDVTLAIRLLEAESWRLPLETDPRWESLEKSLVLEIVPTSLATSRPTVAQPPSKVTDSIDMVLGASGRFRLSARANVQMTSPIDRQPVQFTRQLQSASFRPLWWKLWSLINACGISIAIVGIKLGQRQLEKQRFVLTPWIEAAKRPQAQELLLPPHRGIGIRTRAISFVNCRAC